MRKLLGILFVIVALYLSYYLLKEITWESKPAIIETFQDTMQQTAQKAGTKLKEELDKVEQSLSLQKNLSMENTSATAAVSNTELSTSDVDGIVQFLAAQLDERSPSVTFRIEGSYDKVSSELSNWLDQALVMNEYSRYAMSSYSYTISNKLLYTEVELKTDFRESKEMTEQVQQYVKELIASMNLSQYTKEEQIKLLHDWVVTHVQYDEGLTRYTAYEALTEGLAVCQGYAMLGYMLYSEAGFDARIVEGTAKGQEHAWNMIKLDDRWYQLDLTWDDPVGQAPDDVSYRYYLVSDEELSKDHIWEGDYPVATVSYKTTLKEKAAVLDAQSEAYKELQALREELGFHWHDDEFTVSAYDELRELLKLAVEQKQTELEFRYVEGQQVEKDVEKALRSLNKRLSYQMSYYELSEQGDTAVQLTFAYS